MHPCLQVTGAINEYVQKKVGHAIDPYKTVVQDVDVRLSVRGGDASRGERCGPHLPPYSLLQLSIILSDFNCLYLRVS